MAGAATIGATAFAAATITATMTAIPAHAQSAGASDLPAIDVKVNKPKPKRKRPAPRREQRPQPQPEAADQTPRDSAGRESASQGPASGNPGTPSANIQPMFGQAGAPGGQTVTAANTDRLQADPVFNIADLVKDVPGVSLKQGNGPRDMTVSIRGSGARSGFGVRNIVLFEDDFPVTQPDGLGRTDLTDPHAYSGVDVWRGPSSAMFGNYATGGAMNFRTRRGGEINGVESGIDVGSFGYLNNYVTAGGKYGNVEASIFASDVRGDGYYGYSGFNTQTVNALLSYQVTKDDRVTFKFIDNEFYTELPYRMSLNEFLTNPYQKGCETAATAAAGCGKIYLSRTGNTGVGSTDRKLQTAQEMGANRDDRRTIGGVRWEHNFDADTVWRNQFVIDEKDISQPTSATRGISDSTSYNLMSDISTRTKIFGMDSVSMIGAFWNYMPTSSNTWNLAPDGHVSMGLLNAHQEGSTLNYGVKAREEVALNTALTAVTGITVERTALEGTNWSYKYSTAGVLNKGFPTSVSADRQMTEVAPEFGLLYKPNKEWQVRGRVGTGYGAPQFSNLFVTPTGASGNNTDLQAQTNIGYDVGFDWTPTSKLSFSLTGFYEFFQNELVSQAGSVDASKSFTFNAPASEHRGIELAVDWKPFPGWRLTTAYLLNDQYYTDYVESVSGTLFNRAGNKIPGVASNEVSIRLAYDQAHGPLKGWGAFAEYQWRDAFFADNGNILSIPEADYVNLNVHYAFDTGNSFIKSGLVYFEVRNVFDNTYISGANNISNKVSNGVESPASVLAANSLGQSGTIYAGSPQAFMAGVKFKY
jgi:iron complex outermembrane recepter protein